MGLIERGWLLDLRTSEDDGYVWTDNYPDALEAQHNGATIEEVVPAEQLRVAVSLAGEAADMLDELTVYWATDELPPEIGSRFGEVRDALHRLGGQS